MATVNLGRVGLVLKGEWNSSTQYTALDVVSHDGNAWAAKQSSTNVEPTTGNSDFWQLFSNNESLVATVQGYKNDAASSASAAASSASAAASFAQDGADAIANEANTFSTTVDYATGQYVIYNDGTNKYLYRFNAAHPAGAWIGTDAARYTATDEFPLIQQALGTKADAAEVADLKSAIGEKNSPNLTKISNLNFLTNGTAYATASGLYTQYAPVSAGDKVIITIKNTGSTNLFVRIVYSSSIPANGVTGTFIGERKINNTTITHTYVAQRDGYIGLAYYGANAANATFSMAYLSRVDILENDVSDLDKAVGVTHKSYDLSIASGLNFPTNGSAYATASNLDTQYAAVSAGDKVRIKVTNAASTNLSVRIVFSSSLPANGVSGTMLTEKTVNNTTFEYTYDVQNNGYIGIAYYIANANSATYSISDLSRIDILENDLDDTVSDELLYKTVNAVLGPGEAAYFAGFDEIQTQNASYYNNAIQQWGTTTKRIINVSTLSYPVAVKYTAKAGYSFSVHLFAAPHTFTANGAVAETYGSNWITEFVANACANVLFVVRKGDGTSDIATSEWADALSVGIGPANISDLTALVGHAKTAYAYDGHINVQRHYYEVEKLSFSPSETGTKAVQGLAIYGGVLVQLYSNGTADLIDMSTGTKITTLELDAGHAASASFSNVFYDSGDEFPLLYVAKNSEPKTCVYRISRSGFTLLKTYDNDLQGAGYNQVSCYDRVSGTLWVIGTKNSTYQSGGYYSGGDWIFTHLDLENATDDGNGLYTPTIIEQFQIPAVPYPQCSQYLNGQLFVLCGADAYARPDQLTKIAVVNVGTRAISTIATEFPEDLLKAEPEGIDFVLDSTGYKYYAIIGTRAIVGYYKVTF